MAKLSNRIAGHKANYAKLKRKYEDAKKEIAELTRKLEDAEKENIGLIEQHLKNAKVASITRL